MNGSTESTTSTKCDIRHTFSASSAKNGSTNSKLDTHLLLLMITPRKLTRYRICLIKSLA